MEKPYALHSRRRRQQYAYERLRRSNRRYSGSEPRYNDKKTVSGRLQTRDVGFDRKLPDGKQYIGQLHKAGSTDDKLYGARVGYRLG